MTESPGFEAATARYRAVLRHDALILANVNGVFKDPRPFSRTVDLFLNGVVIAVVRHLRDLPPLIDYSYLDQSFRPGMTESMLSLPRPCHGPGITELQLLIYERHVVLLTRPLTVDSARRY